MSTKSSVRWDSQDSHYSAREGWGLFDLDHSGRIVIQRLDTKDIFSSDDEARAFVEKKSEQGSERHRRALYIADMAAIPTH